MSQSVEPRNKQQAVPPVEEPIQAIRRARSSYSQEDVKAILERAVGAHGHSTMFTREHLEEMATELGVSATQLEAAEEGWMAERLETDERNTFIEHRRRQAIKGVVGVATSAVVAYLAYISGFVPFEILGGIASLLIFFAALGVASDFYEAYFTNEGEEFEDEYDIWLEEREKLRLRAEIRRQKMLGRSVED